MVVYLFNFNTCQDLALLEIGDQQCSPLYAFGPNIRNEYIFHYVVSGKGVVMLQPSGEKGQNILSETIEVKAGEGFLIEPHTAHMYRADENDPWHAHAVSSRVREPLRQILGHPDASKAFIIGQLHLFFDGLMENTAVQSKNVTTDINIANVYIAEAMRYIESRYADIRSLDEIAGFCNVTRSHLARLFRSTLHVTLQEYLINYRMDKAKELLVNTNLPIYQIAQQVGYEGALQFNKAFKNRMQVPPRTWRLQNRLRLSGDPDRK